MKTDTVNTKWNLREKSYDTYSFYSVATGHGLLKLGTREIDKQDAELILTAVNACKDINPDNPLKVAIGLPKLFKVLESVINDKGLPFDLYNDLSSIVDTLKSKF